MKSWRSGPAKAQAGAAVRPRNPVSDSECRVPLWNGFRRGAGRVFFLSEAGGAGKRTARRLAMRTRHTPDQIGIWSMPARVPTLRTAKQAITESASIGGQGQYQGAPGAL